ncbi:chemotaxis protein CheB [Aquimarina sp. RZ0]|uniref:chemotaxis protein CheB n=1 Tax=Aquimarina sp. RZ0 TaxID=2607730 RepID=UPI0011F2C72E|nr:chemotaxis protein CheB [Aquimarina sp. RZ0]KAA1248098.1 PAS domain-containing protein [Aquimarina sp. RZ0]
MEKTLLKGNKKVENSKNTFYIVGIGSSAGGLKALEEFFDHCPSDSGFAFVIIQHLSSDYKSLLVELLSRHTTMPVKEADDEDEVTPNCVYVIPRVKNIKIKEGKIRLTKCLPDTQTNFPIDLFFNSLAVEQKEKALAVILSGTGTDGTKGAKTIKEAGGTVFVQNPDSSCFDGMPKSIISQGLADYILTPNEIAGELIDFVSHPQYIFPIQSERYQDNTEPLEQILKIIKTHLGYDFFYYKKPTLLRRIAKRISITKCQTVENYIDYLHNYPKEKFLLSQEFLIGVTNFFRDHKAFDILEKEVIPSIVSKKEKGQSIKIWTIACSTGEEAYSITILLEEYLKQQKLDINYKVFATDLDDRGIAIATKGIYNQNIESEVPPAILNNYFLKKENQYQIHPNIRKNIIFSKHDVLQNPPYSKMDLVSCRNMLIYMENNIQLKVLSNIHYALNHHGYLFLGSSENLGSLYKNFDEISSKWKIYKNIQSERIINIHKEDAWKIERNGTTRFQTAHSGSSLEDKIAKSINKILMDELLVVSICIDENFEIIHASGKLKKYIDYPDEGYSNNLLKMLPDELNIPISASVRKLSVNPDRTIEKEIKLIVDNTLKRLRLLVRSFNVISINSRSFLITIIEESDRKITQEEKVLIPKKHADDHQLQELKEALSETRENLQLTIEELETSNEETQATNEELLASNEELQSTNEELQSLNEELHAVNAELQEKNIQLIELNSDIENLMKNINIGTIFLDRDFKIRKFTPSINEHFQLRQEDIGRSISHFSGTLGGEDLIKYARQVIKTLQPYKKEVINTTDNYFLMQIFPYCSQEDGVKGVVINFIDIDDLKSAIKEKEKTNNFLSHLMDSNPAIIYIYDILSKKNIYVSANIWEQAGYTSIDIKRMKGSILEKIIYPDDLQNVYDHHEKLKHLKNNDVIQLEYRIVSNNAKKPIWLLSTDKVYERNQDGSVKTILGIAQTITQIKSLELQLKESEERYRLAVMGTGSCLWEWSNLLNDEAWWSPELYTLLGYSQKEMKPTFSGLLNLIHPAQIKAFKTGIETHIENSHFFEEEIQLKTKKEGYKWFTINGQVKFDHNKLAKKVVGTILNIDERKESERKMKELNIELERFAYLASHDLKEPLRTVTSFTRLFKEEYYKKFDDNALQYLDFIEKASSRMITLTNDLLVYSQLDDKSLNFQPLNINDLLLKITEDLQNTISEHCALIEIKKLPEVTCDAVQMRQLFQNLISNSLKYNNSKIPAIEIDCIEKPSFFEFFIKDNGIGILKKNHKKIFEVFKRLHSQTEYEGTGIGLANCKRIVDNHRGKIWVKSSEGKGATFFFTIPKIKTK